MQQYLQQCCIYVEAILNFWKDPSQEPFKVFAPFSSSSFLSVFFFFLSLFVCSSQLANSFSFPMLLDDTGIEDGEE